MKKVIILITTIIIILLIILINYKNILKKIYKTDYSEYVEKYSTQYNVDKYMIYSIIKAESNFKKAAISNKGASGLMQLMDNTAKSIATNIVIEYETGTTLYNPEKNIQLGVKYYSDLKSEFKTDAIALAAYNAGSGNVKEWIKNGTIKYDGSDIENIPYKETNMYVRKILNDYKMYKNIYE